MAINDKLKTKSYYAGEKVETNKNLKNFTDKPIYFADGEISSYKANRSRDRVTDREVEYIERVRGGKGWTAFLAFLGIVAGATLGYGLSFLIPDADIRQNAITDKTATQLLYNGDQQPSQISKKLTQGYTSKQIEERYLLKRGQEQLPGVSAAVERDTTTNYEAGGLYKASKETANIVTLSNNVRNKYISKYAADNTTPLFQVGALYKATGTGDALDIPSTDVSIKYINKYSVDGTTPRYINNGLYLASGTGDLLNIPNVDLTNRYVKKSTLTPGELHKATGTGEALSLGTDVASKYINKYEADGTTAKYVANALYQATGTGDALDIPNTDVTNSYIKKSDLEENALYITTGTGATLTLATKEVPDPNNPGQTITQYDNQINQYLKKSMFTVGGLYIPVIDPITNAPTISLALDADGNPILNANGEQTYQNRLNEYIPKTSLTTKRIYKTSGTNNNISLTDTGATIGGAYVISNTNTLTPLVNNTIDDKIKHFQMYKVYEGGPSNVINSGVVTNIQDAFNKYLPSYAQLTDAEVTTILNNSTKYEIILYIGDRRTTATLRRRVGIYNFLTGTSANSCNALAASSLNKDTNIELFYAWCLTFNSTGSEASPTGSSVGLKKLLLGEVHSDKTNTYGAIRGLQVYVK